jgi:AcrR family transcriptional regulator
VTKPHQPRKQARQARARATEAAIVEAAARILEEDGASALTTNRIAERAGVSIGSLYQYFPDKRSVIAQLLRRERAALLDDIRAVSDSCGDPLAVVGALVDAALRHQFARPAMAMELERMEAELALDDEEIALADAIGAEIADIVRRLDPRADAATARDVVAICRAIVNTAALAGETDPGRIRERVLRAVIGYLRPPAFSIP